MAMGRTKLLGGEFLRFAAPAADSYPSWRARASNPDINKSAEERSGHHVCHKIEQIS